MRWMRAWPLLAVALLPSTAWAKSSPAAQDPNQNFYYCRAFYNSSPNRTKYYTNVVSTGGTHQEINLGWHQYVAQKYGGDPSAMCNWGDRVSLEKLLASDIKDDNYYKRPIVQTGWVYAAGSAPVSSKPPVTHTPRGDYATIFVSCSTNPGPDPIYFSGIFQMTVKVGSGNPKGRAFIIDNNSLDPAKESFDRYLKQKYSYDKPGHLTCDWSDTEQKAQGAKQGREGGLKGPREGKIVETDWKYVAGRN
jgi:hypothetical protein